MFNKRWDERMYEKKWDEMQKYKIKTPMAKAEWMFFEDQESNPVQEPPQSTGETPTPDAEKNGGEEE